MFDNYFLDFKRKIKKKLDYFKSKKSFLIENRDLNKNTSFNKIDLNYFSDLIFVEGYFQSEKYFQKYRKNLVKEFTIKSNLINKENYLINVE